MKQKLTVKHYAFYLLMILMPALGISQTKNLVVTHRVFPKMDKLMEFEKALTAHAQKYHTGDVAWRVTAIQSGPDAGGFQIMEGPTTWTAEDGRGDLGLEHKTDWNKNVAIYLTDRHSVKYASYRDSLSTGTLSDYAEKTQLTWATPKIGQNDNVVLMLKKLKKAWALAGMNVAVLATSGSGKGEFVIATRYKQGLKEREPGFRKPFMQYYEEANGEGSYAQYLKDAAEYLESSWSELLFYRKDLSSK
jgi:hypothetical protein